MTRARIPAVMLLCVVVLALGEPLEAQNESELREAAEAAMKRAATFYFEEVASHGGYVYHYLPDLSRRWGEGEATRDQIWVQPPGTPTVGMAYLKAFRATGDAYYLLAAQKAAEALVYGQMESGGWTNCVDFDPQGARVARYRNGRGRGRNTSSFDDGQTQSALKLLILTDQALRFRHEEIHDAVQYALDAVLKVQFPNGAFPQIFDDDRNPDPEPRPATWPDHDWRTEGRIKQYWHMYTLNDNVAGYLTDTLITANEVYEEPRYAKAVARLGDFLIQAQMPHPQRGWAQQYNYDMEPIWARKFEPPGVSGDETQEVISTLLRIAVFTKDSHYLDPVPEALDYLRKSRLPDGRLARYYELRTNRPLYMERNGDRYSLTYDDSRLPRHYGWKTGSRIDELSEQYQQVKSSLARGLQPEEEHPSATAGQVRQIIEQLDEQGRWISHFEGRRLVGQFRLPEGSPYISSAVFSENLETLSRFIQQ